MTADLPPDAQIELRRRLIPWLVGGAILVMMISLFVSFVILEQKQQLEDRIVARYVLCQELEALKSAQRSDLTEKIDNAETFLRANPKGLPLPGLGAVEIRRTIDRNQRFRRNLAPYPEGCAAFARSPSNLDVQVPEVSTNEGE